MVNEGHNAPLKSVREVGRLGFQPSITILFASVILLVGLTLVYVSFDRAKMISQSAASTFINRVADHTADRVDWQFTSILGALETLRQFPSVDEGDIVQNQRLYALMAALLRNHKQLYNLYVGYADGSFVELDLLDRAGPALRGQLGAPPRAEFRLVVISKAPNESRRTRTTFYLYSDLEIKSQVSREADYDPRERPWYLGAFERGASAMTEPYVFKTVGLTGYTMRFPFMTGRRGIVAGDLLLTDTDAFLRTQKLGLSGVVFLFDIRGRVIAHPRMSEFTRPSKMYSGPLKLPLLERVEKVDILKPLNTWQETGVSPQIFEDEGRTYVAAFRSVGVDGSANLYLAVMAPLDEFFSEIEFQRRKLFLLTLVILVAALPVVWWLGSLMARSIRALVVETERIQRFELEAPAQPVRSFIREIDDLSRSVSTMRTVVSAFSSFIPRRLVQQLIETGDALRLGGTRRQVTIMFTDIEGFTNIAERADPEQVMLYTSRYFAALSDAITLNKGTIDKFVGDAIMAIWNAPADDADHVTNACRAALACLDANHKLNVKFEREGWPVYRTRFGLHTGEAVVGNVGSSDRMNYTVVGATVNLAARLEPLNKEFGTSILVSQAIVDEVNIALEFKYVGDVRPKGFEGEVRVFELRGPMPSASERNQTETGAGIPPSDS